MELRLAGCVRESVCDGPGLRLVLFVQGCRRNCPGCHNPEALDPQGGESYSLEEIERWVDEALRAGGDGVTFSGGEPFDQAAPLAQLAARIKKKGAHLVVYSGYTLEELLARGAEDEAVNRLLGYCDWLIDGPYLEGERDLTLAFRGSRNQRIIVFGVGS